MAWWETARKSETIRLWLRRKNFTILLFFLLYVVVRAVLWYDEHYGTIIPEAFLLLVGALPLIFLTFFIVNIVNRLIGPAVVRFFRDELEPEQRIFFAKLFDILVYVAGLGFILYSFGATFQSLATFLGFVAIGLALAVREPVLSFFVWLIVLNKKPFRIGDHVRIAQYTGAVERIGTFYLTLSEPRRLDGQEHAAALTIKMPNKIILEQPIENYGKTDVQYVLRLQLRRPPRTLAKALTQTERHAAATLASLGFAQKVSVTLERKNDPAGDKDYVLARYAVPPGMRERSESAIVQRLLEKQRAMYA